MKSLMILTLVAVTTYWFYPATKEIPAIITQTQKEEELKVQAYQYPEEIQNHKNYQLALKSIERINELEAQAKQGEFKKLESTIQKLEKEISSNPSQRKKIDFQDCLVLWIKYFQKRTLKDHPQELFRFLTYNPQLYKQYLLAIHEGFSPDMTYQNASQFLLESLKGVR